MKAGGTTTFSGSGSGTGGGSGGSSEAAAEELEDGAGSTGTATGILSDGSPGGSSSTMRTGGPLSLDGAYRQPCFLVCSEEAARPSRHLSQAQ